MRLRGISLANFKSFAGRVEVPFGQVTSIIGPSGAGKSNIVDGLEKIAALLVGTPYEPGPGEYFDNNDSLLMQLGATLELSNGEQQALLARTAGALPGGRRGPAGRAPFRFARYLASFRGAAKRGEEISLSTSRTDFHPFARARLVRRGYLVEAASIAGVDPGQISLAPPKPYGVLNAVSAAGLAEMVDPSLSPAMLRLCSGLRIVAAAAGIPGRVPARGGAEIGADGQNMPNELGSLQRSEQIEFDEYMMPVTHGDPLGVEPAAAGLDRVLAVRENGLTRRAAHVDLGSGQRRTLILGWQLFRGRDRILVIRDPDLYLHAERQRRIFGLICDKSRRTGTQFVIETRSPSFLGDGAGNRTVLVGKRMGRSDVSEVGPEGAPAIRRMLGITHADVLGSDNVLLVEGESEVASFGTFLHNLAPGQSRRTVVHGLEGANKIKSADMLIKYLEETEGRSAFVILDENRDARSQIMRLQKHGHLAGNVYFLEKSFEDAFDDKTIAEAVTKMAGDYSIRHKLGAGEVARLRGAGRDVASALADWWRLKTGHDFNKVELARLLVSAAGGRPPPGIERALRSAMAHFESGAGGGSAPAPPGWTLAES